MRILLLASSGTNLIGQPASQRLFPSVDIVKRCWEQVKIRFLVKLRSSFLVALSQSSILLSECEECSATCSWEKGKENTVDFGGQA